MSHNPGRGFSLVTVVGQPSLSSSSEPRSQPLTGTPRSGWWPGPDCSPGSFRWWSGHRFAGSSPGPVSHFDNQPYNEVFLLWQTFFCITSWLLASTRWVWLVFSSQCPLFSKQGCWLISATLAIFSSEKISGMLVIKPGAAGSGSKYATHRAMLPPEDR